MSFIVWYGVNNSIWHTKPYLIYIILRTMSMLHVSIWTIISHCISCLYIIIVPVVVLYSFLLTHYFKWPAFALESCCLCDLLFLVQCSAHPFGGLQSLTSVYYLIVYILECYHWSFLFCYSYLFSCSFYSVPFFWWGRQISVMGSYIRYG